jgi:hypothetical protein
MVIVVTPFREMIGEFKAWEVGTGIFEVNDDKLFVLILWVKEW